MSKQFVTEAAEILGNAAAPDAEATTIKEYDGEAPAPRKRGRPAGSGGGNKKKTTSKPSGANTEDFAATAKAMNTIIFSMACVFTGTREAWPESEKEAVMDKALSRYLELKDLTTPPEIILLGAYASYIGAISTKKEVQEGVAKRFGGVANKFSFMGKILSKFKLKKANADNLKIKN